MSVTWNETPLRPWRLGYVGLHAQEPDRWAAFAASLFAAACHSGPDGAVCVRLDEALARLHILPGRDGALAFVGWQCADGHVLAGIVQGLRNAGHAVAEADEQLCRSRGVGTLYQLCDPSGHAVELFCDPVVHADGWRDGRPAARLGHVVLGVPDLGAAQGFYEGGLGLRLSDRIAFMRGDRPLDLAFLRAADGRHHSLALACVASGVNHVMIEVENADALGLCLDRCRAGGIAIRREIGRHSNDRMLSFYARSPNGVDIEIGCEGIHVDEASWTVVQYRSTSLWGHQLVG